MSGKFEEMINNAKITELLNKKKAEEEQHLEMAEEQVSDRIDAWITEVFHRAELST